MVPESAERDSEQRLRERVLRGMMRAAAAEGYEAATVAGAIAAAGVGRRTFYRFFGGKEDCFLAAFDLAAERVDAELRAVARVEAGLLAGSDDGEAWPRRVRARLRAVLELFDSEPDLGRVALVEVNAAGPEGVRRQREAMWRLGPCLERGRSEQAGAGGLPRGLATMAIGAAAALMAEELRRPDPDLMGLLDDLHFALLLPYLGAEAAAEEMRRAGRLS